MSYAEKDPDFRNMMDWLESGAAEKVNDYDQEKTVHIVFFLFNCSIPVVGNDGTNFGGRGVLTSAYECLRVLFNLYHRGVLWNQCGPNQGRLRKGRSS